MKWAAYVVLTTMMESSKVCDAFEAAIHPAATCSVMV